MDNDDAWGAQMNYSLLLAGLAVVFFALLLIAMRIGKWLGRGADEKGAPGTAVVMTAALYIIIDFEFPRIGTIRIDQSDALLVSQRQSMVDPVGRAN
ncbi:hypothetical protein [Achromobacter veterisilvae]|uniref:hypothetical protein n=1 Tax=Achromobacter veterisilvae TaxID=2069367 RepID=UPI00100DD6C2|nr:hypothetical protein [Achromobacter veterisilvae]